jgi:hypothetical protein
MSTHLDPSRRLEAHRLLGIAEHAPPAAVEAAYWRLRAHIEARASDSSDVDFLSERREELEQLETALGHDPAAARSVRSEPRSTTLTPTWVMGVAIAATLVASLLGALLYQAWAGAGAAATVAKPSLVTVHARPTGSHLQILSLSDEQLVMQGAADGSPVRVEPGAYRLIVTRPDCPDEWQREISLEAGDRRDFAPRICSGRGALVVQSNVSGDRVQIDGLDVGTTGEAPHPLPVGDHQVTVQKPGHQLWSGRVRIRPDETLGLLAELVPDPAFATPTAATPAGAQAAVMPPQPPPSPPGATTGPQPEGRIESSGLLADDALAEGLRTGPGGSKSWHDAIRDRLVYSYDRNGSRSLDQADEINAIPCAEWQSIESSYETGGLAVNMTRLYGFDGSDAPANTLGVTESMRPYAYDRMKSCGLKADL